MSPLDQLIEQFERFPGVGARQARRFAFHVLSLPEADTETLATTIQSLRHAVNKCTTCQRFFVHHTPSDVVCSICSDENRDTSTLLIVSADTDITSIERSGTYSGLYFVLGGTIPLLSNTPGKRIRGNALKHLVEQSITNNSLEEIILGFPVNPDGENTARYVEQLLKDTLSDTNVSLSVLGRGLSTGSEIEYADTETIKNALQNRYTQ